MRARALLTTGAAALVLVLVPTAALAQDTTDDPSDTEATFVPSGPGSSDDTTDPDPATDELPNTGGGLAALGGLVLAGAAAVRTRR